MNKRIEKILLTGLIMTIFALSSLGALNTSSDTISLRKIRIYVYYINIYTPFRTGSYELLISFKFMRHFETFGDQFLDDDNQYSNTGTYFQSCETFDGGQTGIEYCYEYFDYSYCKPLGEYDGIFWVTFRVKKNVISFQDVSYNLGLEDDEYGVYYDKSAYYSLYEGALIVRYMIMTV